MSEGRGLRSDLCRGLRRGARRGFRRGGAWPQPRMAPSTRRGRPAGLASL